MRANPLSRHKMPTQGSLRQWVVCLVLLVLWMSGGAAQAAKNVILMIGDGMGFQHVNAASDYLNGAAGTLAFEPYSKGQVTTWSLNSAITDSAAAASALATGHKVNNNAISQSPAGQEYETILQIASGLGKRTGLVTTDPITRATPAAFGSHDPSRYNYLAIGDDYLNITRPDVLFGGGGTSSGGSEYFSSAQIASAGSFGYQTVFDKSQMTALNPATVNKALGLFSTLEMPYEYDGYPSTMPHLSEMTFKALEILSADPDGFFLMIEGAKIDWAAHAQDISRTTQEVVEFNHTAQVVLDWMQGRNDTLLLVTGDHETGGLAVTNNGSNAYPTATWATTDHTAANVPLYAAGNGSDLVNGYIQGGVVDNTAVFSIMNAAITAPVPEPASVALLVAGGFLVLLRRRRAS